MMQHSKGVLGFTSEYKRSENELLDSTEHREGLVLDNCVKYGLMDVSQEPSTPKHSDGSKHVDVRLGKKTLAFTFGIFMRIFEVLDLRG
jgi:hypothetical protein